MPTTTDCPENLNEKTDEEIAIESIIANLTGGVSSYTHPNGTAVSLSNPEVTIEALRKAIELKDRLNHKPVPVLQIKPRF